MRLPIALALEASVFIPMGVPYVFEGHMTYVVMNGPGFVEGSDKVVE